MLSQSKLFWSFHYFRRESDITFAIDSLSKYISELARFVCFLQVLQKDYFQYMEYIIYLYRY